MKIKIELNKKNIDTVNYLIMSVNSEVKDFDGSTNLSDNLITAKESYTKKFGFGEFAKESNEEENTVSYSINLLDGFVDKVVDLYKDLLKPFFQIVKTFMGPKMESITDDLYEIKDTEDEKVEEEDLINPLIFETEENNDMSDSE